MPDARLPISAGMLSWRAPKTVERTLGALGDYLRLFGEFKVFFQECSEEDSATAEKFGVDWVGRKENVGIQAGMRWVVENLSNEFVLYLENDFVPCVPFDEASRQLESAIDWIRSGRVDIVRLRSRFNPGFPCGDPEKYSSVFAPKDLDPRFGLHDSLAKTKPLVRWLRPFKSRRAAARAAYVEREPEKLFPKVFARDETGLVTTSAYLNWTNNPVLLRRDLFLRIADYADGHPTHRTVGGFQDFEKPLNCRWWRSQRLRIGLPDGIFTHRRIDR